MLKKEVADPCGIGHFGFVDSFLRLLFDEADSPVPNQNSTHKNQNVDCDRPQGWGDGDCLDTEAYVHEQLKEQAACRRERNQSQHQTCDSENDLDGDDSSCFNLLQHIFVPLKLCISFPE